MRGLDFSSWSGVLTTLIGLAAFTLIGVGVRLVVMLTIQQRRERANRQINERLKTLIAAYKVLGGSFTGRLDVDPTHLGDLRRRAREAPPPEGVIPAPDEQAEGSDRARRIRDAVEAALSDIILLGTEPQVRLASEAARALVEGRPVQTHELVVSLRDFIRHALDLDPIPADITLPRQGPTRPASGGGRGGSDRGGQGRGGGARGGAGGMGMGMGMGLGIGAGPASGGTEPDPRPG